MKYPLYIAFGLLPSFIWLLFYLRKDKHPEPNSMVLKIFIWGMLLSPLALILEAVLIWLLNPSSNPIATLNGETTNSFLIIALSCTLIPALVEELLKYLIVRAKILKHSAFDEPTDAMLYCIIAGLGFAAVENLMIALRITSLGQTLNTMLLRFVGATFVHALASGIVGYWLALGIMNIKKIKRFVSIGLVIAIAFHSCYNYLILLLFNSAHPFKYLTPIAILLITVGLTVSYSFRKLKKYQSICI